MKNVRHVCLLINEIEYRSDFNWLLIGLYRCNKNLQISLLFLQFLIRFLVLYSLIRSSNYQ